MADGIAAPRATINGNNANVDSMIQKLNQRLSDLAAGIGVQTKASQGSSQPASTAVSNVLSSTQNHINWLQAAHSYLDDIEATLGPQGS